MTAREDCRPYVRVKIRDRSFIGLLDTGAMASVIGQEVAKFLEQEGFRADDRATIARMADGNTAEIKGRFRFECEVGPYHTVMTARHLPSLATSLIVGMDVINELQLITFKLGIGELITNAEDPFTFAVVTELTEPQKRQLSDFLKNEFTKFEGVNGVTRLMEHEIRLKDCNPIKQRYYPRNPYMQQKIYDEVDSMLTGGVIEPSSSPWSSPIVLVKKASGGLRFCIDFRKVNEASEKDAYPLPRIDSILDKLREARFISTLDLKSGYWQVPLKKESRPITAFTVPGKGLFQFRVMPFGLHSAGATFQRLVDRIFGPELEPRVFAYLDDVVVISKTFEEHLELLKEVFGRLREADLRLNIEKCHFCKKELKYLGHLINEEGVQTDPEKVRAITEFPEPKAIKTLRSFLGLASWYRRFISNFAKITAPLTRLLRKDAKWSWGVEQKSAFEKLKNCLTRAPALACPDFSVPFTLQVDASGEGLGAALTQVIGGKEIVISYASRLLSDGEKRFTVTELECLALVWSVKKFRPYIEGYKFIAVTDHQALKWLMSMEKPSGRLARWIMELQQHQFEIKYRKGALNKVADALSRNPVDRPLELDSVHENGANERGDNLSVEQGRQRCEWYEQLCDKVRKRPDQLNDYCFHEGKLYRKFKRKLRGNGNGNIWKLCVPIYRRTDVLRETHDQITAGHLGIRKTMSRVRNLYFWPRLAIDVKQYVRECAKCQLHKVEQAKAYGKMYFRKPVGPWYMVTADLIGPLPRSKRGNRFALVVQDTYTKWVELAAMKSATVKQVAERFNEHVLLRYGAPEVVITDNGTQFTSNGWKRLLKEWGIQHQLTAPYSPQANPVERVNRVLKTMIRQYLKDDHRDWDRTLSEFRYGMNTAVHDSTGYSPCMLNFGREFKIPNTVYGQEFEVNENTEPVPTDRRHTQRLERQRNIFRNCHQNLRKAYEQQARFYNLRRRECRFQVGNLVLKRQHVLSSAENHVAGALAAKYVGPFKICGCVGANVYTLVDTDDRDAGRAHAKDLKPFVSGGNRNE